MRASKRSCELPISVLNLPPKDPFIQTSSPSKDYTLYKVGKGNMFIEASQVLVQKVKLFTNLQIYQWRYRTQFPITKTKYVSIEASKVDSPQIIALTVFNEHCPIKINQLFEIRLCQTIYLLKECLIGFERLIDKFGGFEIHQEMIGVNEKGLCRVWINKNFALNSFVEKQVSQYESVQKIVQIIEKISQQSKGSKKLFQKLRECTSFLRMVKEIRLYIQNNKILVPSRFVLNSKQENLKRGNVNINIIPPQEVLNKDNARISLSKFAGFSPRKDISQTEDRRRRSPQIKRFKSQEKINSLKTSEDQTGCTNNNEAKQLKVFQQKECNREKSNEKTGGSFQNGSGRVWLQSSFVMEIQQNEERNLSTQKKQLSYSVEMIKIDQQGIRNKTVRKLSVGMEGQDNAFYRFSSRSRRQESLARLSSQAIEYEKRRSFNTDEEQEEEKLKQHSDTIMKNNGWNSLANLMGGLKEVKELKNSFHEGQEERTNQKEVKLQKLNNIGRKSLAMSILPEEFEEVI